MPAGRRAFPSQNECTRLYGASSDDLDAVSAFVEAQGLEVTESHAGRSRVVAEGTAAQVGEALGIAVQSYRMPRANLTRRVTREDGRPIEAQDETVIHRGFEGPVHLPASLVEVVRAVIGIDNRPLGAPAGSGDPPSAWALTPTAVAELYNFPKASAAGQTIGLYADAWGGACFLNSDVTDFIDGLPAGYQTQPNVTVIGLKVGTTTYSNVTTPIASGKENDAAYEITQDISTAAAIAQGVNVNVYMTDTSEAGWEAFLNRAIVP